MHPSLLTRVVPGLLLAGCAWAADDAEAGERVKAGAQIYARPGMCITCHQAEGAGIPGAFPPLAKSSWVTDDDAALVRIILGGLEGPITVGETAFNAVMPAQGGQLTDDEVAQVASYVRASWGNHARSVPPQTVTRLRKQQEARGEKPWSADELQAIGKHDKEYLDLESVTTRLVPGAFDALPAAIPAGATASDAKRRQLDGGALPPGGRGIVVAEGDFTAFKAGRLELCLSGGAAAQVRIDGVSVIAVGCDDTLSYAEVPVRRTTGGLDLTVGKHRVQLAYVVGDAGQKPLALMAKVPGLSASVGLTSLRGGFAEALPPGMELVPTDAPLVYRAPFAGTSSRSIAVGYPQGPSLIYDAVNLQWRTLWRGAFISGGHHWTGRGMGFEEVPLGNRVVVLPPEQPFAVLASSTDTWPAACDKDSWPEGYRFRGYRLDQAKRPVFAATVSGIAVSDAAEPLADGYTLRRRLHLTAGTAPGRLYYRPIAGQALQDLGGGSYRLAAGFVVQLHLPHGLTPLVRRAGEISEVLVPLTSGSVPLDLELIADYRWEH